VARVQSLNHDQQLSPSNLTDCKSVGPHSQSLANQTFEGHLARTLNIWLSSLQRYKMPGIQTDFANILDRNHSLTTTFGKHGSQQGSLPSPSPTGNQEVFAPRDYLAQQKLFGFPEHVTGHQLIQAEVPIEMDAYRN
jgi:hypothetical protein